MDQKMNVAFLCQYPIYTLDIEEVKDLFNNQHTTPWITNLVASLKATYPDMELHVVTESVKVKKNITVVKNNIYFHIVRSGSAVPFTKFHYPSFMPVDKLFLYYLNSLRLTAELRSIRPDIIHAHGTEFSYAISAVRSGFKTLISVQGLINLIFKDSGRVFFKLSRYLERAALRQGKYFIPKSNFVKNYVKELNPSAFFFDIENIIGEAYFHAEAAPIKDPQIIFVGSLQRSKGIEDLLNAFAMVRSGNLVVIGAATETELRNRWITLSKYFGKGTPTYSEHLATMVRDLQIAGRVQFRNKQPSSVIADELSKSKVLVLPSYMENKPNVIMEALVVGIPVVAYNVGGIPDLIQDGYNGYLVEPGHIKELAGRIETIINDTVLFEKLSHNAKSSVANKFEAATVAKKTYEAYVQIVNN